jgi:hypothetical protein
MKQEDDEWHEQQIRDAVLRAAFPNIDPQFLQRMNNVLAGKDRLSPTFAIIEHEGYLTAATGSWVKGHNGHSPEISEACRNLAVNVAPKSLIQVVQAAEHHPFARHLLQRQGKIIDELLAPHNAEPRFTRDKTFIEHAKAIELWAKFKAS